MPVADGRRWWRCALDAQGLAWSAVDEAVKAVARLGAARGRQLVADTTPELVAASFAAMEHLQIDGRGTRGWAPLSGFVAARDGWVRLHANYPHHAAALTAALGLPTASGEADRAALEEVIGRLAAADVETRVRAAGGIAVAVRTRAEWAEQAHGAASAGDPWVRVDLGAPRPALAPAPAGDLPLAGVRVLDLTRVIAGPTCSQLLACLGADVLRIDSPHRPELLDQYLSNGMGKRSTVLDLQSSGAVPSERLLHEGLLPAADVVLLGYRPGSLDRFGLDPEELRRRYPRLVVASLSAWGESGPWARRPGFDSIVQAASGIATSCGDGDEPGALPVQALDHASGYVLAARVLDLLAQARAGLVRISLLGAARTLLAMPPPPPAAPVPMTVPQVALSSPHGSLVAVPPPIRVDATTIERPISGYGAAEPTWL
ncbi:crotonobetainyl-CoA:carnitine CoA-transferase CaiB-like acyl-CoA transferase [Kineosphaera limosa]|uniref:CoA-transferase n=1 Tax=Kineosphaera limosa NBRC 100340 TaxID=1184609 RepID=K6XF34_9MICO|nr:CoA transferase [Kineosphaera limosa]NYE02558.1 crotonobetainyl-CoA:carnitine CoA-transferase CaiB-like acyl-CoA transferase [Kineosphaera limosa]GAB97429.1 hypothetical protein KILIM_067_00310 [Kineosphaera limosa NBRC 100340]